ncbi:MAG TPA: GspH/FimT family pseudopilin [Steroidobacter sp.]|uniref:GspH/FimT family pseudopilin n=1 Tax=Steroidobacter sp. TaxID=1978227 RepID=UPI002ED8E26F
MKKAPNRVPPRSAGFTLLELLVTVSVLALIVGIGVPSFQDIIRRNRLTEQTNGLLSALALARSEATKRSGIVTVCPANDPEAPTACADDADWTANGLIVFSDNIGDRGTLDSDEDNPETNDVVVLHLAPASTQNITISTDRGMVSYDRDGALAQGTPSMEFALVPEGCRGDDGGRVVQLTTTGRARSQKSDCNGD